MERCGLDGVSRQAQLAEVADFGLRGASGIVAARTGG